MEHFHNWTAQVNELLAKVIAYNLTVVIHEMYENDINPGFLHVSKIRLIYNDKLNPR